MGVTARLLAAIGLNNEQFKAGMASTRGQTSGLKTEFSALKSAIAGAFTVGALVSFIGKLKDYAGDVMDFADQTGASTAAVQALTAAGIDNGASQDKLRVGLQKLRAAQVDALEGNQTLRAAFERLGIKMEQIEEVGADRVFELIGTAIYTAENQTTALAAAGDILGTKLATSLIPILKAVGEEGLNPLIDRQREAGNLMEETMIVKIDKLGDRWENAKNKIAIAVANSITWMERLGYATNFAVSTGSLENWGKAWKAMKEIEAEANAKAVDSLRAANAGIIQSEQEKVETVTDGAKELEAEKIRAAKDAAKAEIEAARKAAAEQKALYAQLVKARDSYYRAAANAAFDALSPEQQLQSLMEKRLGLLSAIQTMISDNGAEGVKSIAEYYVLQTEVLEVERDIANRQKTDIPQVTDLKSEDIRITEDQVVALKAMQKLLAGMSEREIKDFRVNLKKLHDAVGGLDFSNLNGLGVLNGFKIPNTSITQAERFGTAIAAMFTAIAQVKQIPDLSQLENLRGFDVATGADIRLGQLGSALIDFIDKYNQKKLNLAPFDSLVKLVDAIGSGKSIKIAIQAPSKDQLTLQLPSGLETTLTSINGHLSTLAGLRGVLYS